MIAAKVVYTILEVVGDHSPVHDFCHIINIYVITLNMILKEVDEPVFSNHPIEAIYDIGILALMEFAPSKDIEETEANHLSVFCLIDIGIHIFVEKPFRPSIDIMRHQVVKSSILFFLVAINGR